MFDLLNWLHNWTTKRKSRLINVLMIAEGSKEHARLMELARLHGHLDEKVALSTAIKAWEHIGKMLGEGYVFFAVDKHGREYDIEFPSNAVNDEPKVVLKQTTIRLVVDNSDNNQ